MGGGLASYFLIGFYWEDMANVNAGNKAFMVNKVADVGLILGAIILGLAIGTFDFFELSTAAFDHSKVPWGSRSVGGALLLLRGDGQSGPIPSSHLASRRHGRPYLDVGIDARGHNGHRRRLSDGTGVPLFEYLASDIRPWMAAIGAITLFAIGLLALVADDIKKVLAYSTVSQLGYMMTAVVAGGYTAGAVLPLHPCPSSRHCSSSAPGR